MADVAAMNSMLSILMNIFPEKSGSVLSITKIIYGLGLALGK